MDISKKNLKEKKWKEKKGYPLFVWGEHSFQCPSYTSLVKTLASELRYMAYTNTHK